MTQAGKTNNLNILQGFSKLGLKSKATILAIAVKTSTDANKVSNAFKDLLEVAQKLQKSLGQLKV